MSNNFINQISISNQSDRRQNVGWLLSEYTALCPRRCYSSKLPLWEPQILLYFLSLWIVLTYYRLFAVGVESVKELYWIVVIVVIIMQLKFSCVRVDTLECCIYPIEETEAALDGNQTLRLRWTPHTFYVHLFLCVINNGPHMVGTCFYLVQMSINAIIL
jgi:hypothetical protein